MADHAKKPHSIWERLRAVEDHLEIMNLIASHPPSADTGADYFTRAAYTETNPGERHTFLETVLPDAAVRANGLPDLIDVGAKHFANVRDLVHERDAGRQDGVRGVLAEL